VITPNSASSVVLVKATGNIAVNDNLFAGLRLRNKTTSVTLTSQPFGNIDSRGTQKNSCFTLIGFLTGVTGANTIALQAVGETAGADVRISGNATLDSQALLTRIEAIELR